MFRHISLALHGQPYRFLYGNLVGRLITLNRVLGRIACFYNPAQLLKQYKKNRLINRDNIQQNQCHPSVVDEKTISGQYFHKFL